MWPFKKKYKIVLIFRDSSIEIKHNIDKNIPVDDLIEIISFGLPSDMGHALLGLLANQPELYPICNEIHKGLEQATSPHLPKAVLRPSQVIANFTSQFKGLLGSD